MWAARRNGCVFEGPGSDAQCRQCEIEDLIGEKSVGIEFQQNLQEIGIAVVVLAARNRIQDLRPLISQILTVLQKIEPGGVVRIVG